MMENWPVFVFLSFEMTLRIYLILLTAMYVFMTSKIYLSVCLAVYLSIYEICSWFK